MTTCGSPRCAVTGELSALDPAALEPVEPSKDLLHRLLAVLHHPPGHPAIGRQGAGLADGGAMDEDEAKEQREAENRRDAAALAGVNVAGFVVVKELSEDGRSMTVLAPCPGRLPSYHLVTSTGADIQWLE